MRPRPLLLLSALLVCAGSVRSSSWVASQDGAWTERLGLRFRDDCQEDAGLSGLLMWLIAWAVRRGQQRSGHCESKEMRCPSGARVTGLQVRYARLEKGDRDLYDFKPRCDTAWQAWLGMRFPEGEADHEQTEAAICHGTAALTGIQVMRGRNERRDWDYYNFKLRCNKHWERQPLGLSFDGLRETRSATCPGGAPVTGLRVHRGFQDWGDVDTYEFQLFCSTAAPAPAQSRKRGGSGSGAGLDPPHPRPRGAAAAAAEPTATVDLIEPSRRGQPVGDGAASWHGGEGKSPSSHGKMRGSQKASTFGSRAAEADAMAEEVRRELREAEKARRAAEPVGGGKLKDEL